MSVADHPSTGLRVGIKIPRSNSNSQTEIHLIMEEASYVQDLHGAFDTDHWLLFPLKVQEQL
jgi:hypothetical protein